MRERQKTRFARQLRRQMTDAEASLWHHLRNRALMGCKFRRQHPIGPYIADSRASNESWSSNWMAANTLTISTTRLEPAGSRQTVTASSVSGTMTPCANSRWY